MTADLLPDDLSMESRRELARNRGDMHFAETDEELAYNWIRFWAEGELREVMKLRYERAKARALQTRSNGIIEALEKKLRMLEGVAGDVSESGDEMDDLRKQTATKKLADTHKELVDVEQRLQKHKDVCQQARDEVKEIDPKLRLAEKAMEAEWNRNMSFLVEGKTRTQLSTEHTKNYIVNFLMYPGYYRELPQMKTSWIGDHMMAIWGGVRNFKL